MGDAMKTRFILIFGLFFCVNALAGPARPITSGTFLTQAPAGPAWDGQALQGQWFMDAISGAAFVNAWEYCDDTNSLTIAGVVQNITFSNPSNNLSNILAFDVAVTVVNNLPVDYQYSGSASNSHGEVLTQPAPSGPDTMRDTRITAEFALADLSMIPSGSPPYWPDPVSGGAYYIVAANEDLHAWYCWDPISGLQPAGQFQVPAWNLIPADIPPGGSSQVTMQFIVTGSGLPAFDYRHSVIRASRQLGLDLLYNRHPSLKISHWLDTLLIDNGYNISTPPPPYWEDEPLEYIYESDASVFYNLEAPELPNKMHWPQLPDPNGWDVRACNWDEQAGGDGKTKILADDFECTETGFITNIMFWGSFRYDEYDVEQLFHGVNNFHFSFHSDIPDPDPQDPATYSMPLDPPLWEVDIDPYNPPPGFAISVEKEIIDSSQGWYDPNNPQLTEHPNHVEYFRYTLGIDPSNAFFQVVSNIYWLDISVQTDWPLWGWKTSGSQHFNDDAVWADLPRTNQWQELRDPFEPEISLDLAFVIDGGEEVQFDFGDAPDWTAGTAPGDYETVLADNGAYHTIVAGAPYFDDGSGSDQPDAEADGQPDPNATGDDINGLSPDDEDGIAIPILVIGQAGTVVITVDDGSGGLGAGGGYVDAWIDFNGDGVWATPGEQIYSGWIWQGPSNVTVSVPASAVAGQTFGRFRINSQAAGLPPTGGPALDGEVEDHEVFIEEPPEELDYGDAPTNYPSLLANNGARHAPSGLYLGNLIDLELDGQPTIFADGDDANNLMDEDGIIFPLALISGSPSSVQALVTGTNGILQGWVDWNADGIWSAAEQIITDQSVSPGINTVNFPVPIAATNTPVYARFRISTQTGLGPAGYSQDGEVEDYLIDLEPLKWLQVPEQGQEGVDVNNTYHQLADDFQCTASGPITDIHIWGSFWNDILPPGGPDQLGFKLSIWSDVPAGIDAEYSHPGEQLWSHTFPPGTYFAGRIWTVQEGEWWHDPGSTTWIHPGDFNIYQFDFYPPAADAFVQIEGNIYWLAVEYFYDEPGIEFGWKTTPDAFNDDAVYWDPTLPPIYWKDLVYGPTHERSGESLELAFALSGVEGDVEDWGDAPDVPYPTRSGSAGARHIILTNFYLGNRIDAEMDGQPNVTATGDDNTAFDDEDGISFGAALIRGSSVPVNVFLTSGIGSGTLDAWLDLDGNGTWGGSEKVINSATINPGTNTYSISIPTSAALGTNYARFRLTLGGIATPGGAASEGEVEDYQVVILQPAPSPDIVITNITVTASNNTATVQWNAQSGITYQMQSTTNLTVSNSWMNTGAEVIGPSNTQTNPATPTNQFYRIMAPWTP
jgi:hypothetical protein